MAFDLHLQCCNFSMYKYALYDIVTTSITLSNACIYVSMHAHELNTKSYNTFTICILEYAVGAWIAKKGHHLM